MLNIRVENSNIGRDYWQIGHARKKICKSEEIVMETIPSETETQRLRNNKTGTQRSRNRDMHRGGDKGQQRAMAKLQTRLHTQLAPKKE